MELEEAWEVELVGEAGVKLEADREREPELEVEAVVELGEIVVDVVELLFEFAVGKRQTPNVQISK